MKEFTLYEATIPVFILYLSNLERIIKKAKRFSKRHSIPEKRLVEGTLAPDMYNFIQQVGYAYFTALETTTNLTKTQAPQFDYNEKTFSDLQKSLRRTIIFLKGRPRNSFRGATARQVETFLDPGKKHHTQDYVLKLALPNFFFHITTAYDILRHLKIPLVKDDYLGLK